MSYAGAAVHVGSVPADFLTQVGDVKYIYFHDFMTNLPHEPGDVIVVTSPEFVCAGHRWTVNLYLEGDRQQNASNRRDHHHEADANIRFVGWGRPEQVTNRGEHIVVTLKSQLDSEIVANYDMTVMDARGKRDISQTKDNQVFANKEEKTGLVVYLSQISRGITGLLTNGTLTLKICIRPRDLSYAKHEPQSSLSKNVLKLFLDEDDTTDIAFKVKGVLIYAHRVILKAQAPELAEMCENCNKANPMPVDDVEPEVFRTMLKHVYGEVILTDGMISQSMSIIKAAGKYGFGHLKSEAEHWHVKNLKLTVENVVDNLLEADGGSFTVIKEACMKFIVENLEQIVDSETYDNLYKSPSLMKEVMKAMSKQLSKKDKRVRVVNVTATYHRV